MSETSFSLPVTAVSEAEPALLRAAPGLTLSVYQSDGSYYAIDDRCPHQGVSLAGGDFADGIVTCPAHGFKVDVRTGRCPHSAFLKVRAFPVRREGDQLFVEVAAGDLKTAV